MPYVFFWNKLAWVTEQASESEDEGARATFAYLTASPRTRVCWCHGNSSM